MLCATICRLHRALQNSRHVNLCFMSCRLLRTSPQHQEKYEDFKRIISAAEDTNKRQLILGIETSCDDTGAAVVDNSGLVLGEALHSQLPVHVKFGGIIPPVAQKLHQDNIERVVTEALNNARVTVEDLDAVATTVKPGMVLSLLVGADYGKNLALKFGKPFIPIHHMEAHALTVRMIEQVDFPFLVLLVSGGHSLLLVAHSVDRWSMLGHTLDIAPGEVFDKAARRMKLRNIAECASMSGGQAIEHLAAGGDPRAFTFTTPLAHHRDCSFSFTGLQNMLRRLVESLEEEHGIEGSNIIPRVEDVCASFQYAVTKHLVRQTQRAMIYAGARGLLSTQDQRLVVSGGVACNQYVRRAVTKVCDALDYKFYCPPPKLCSDNGIMIAWNGIERWKAQSGVLYSEEEISAVDIQGSGKCPVGEDLTEDVKSLQIKPKKWVKI